MHRTTRPLTAALLLLAVLTPAGATEAGRVLYVDDDAPAGGDGTSWKRAWRDLQAALKDARPGDQIWVAEGTYTPGTERSVSFALKEGVALYGGFAGGETRVDTRDWKRHASVLSGDIGRPGVETDNSWHVVLGANGAVLDGFTITGGYSLDTGPGANNGGPPQGGPPDRNGPPPRGGPPPPRGGPPPKGGGGGGPQVHTTPEALLAGLQPGFGAGMANFKVDLLTVRNCVFRGNKGMAGGAMYNLPNLSDPRAEPPESHVRIVDTDFVDNYAAKRGGAVIDNLGASPTFVDVTFVGNETPEKGGALYDDFGASPQLYNVLFARNRAANAAAMGNDGGSSPIVVNATFVANEATETGAALYQGTGGPNEPTVTRSIVWGNKSGEGPGDLYNWHHSAVHFEDSVVTGASVGPTFVNAAAGDYRLVPGSPLAQRGLGWDPSRSGADLVGTVASKAGARVRPEAVTAWTPRPPPRGVVYVTPTGDGDGSSWKHAFSSVQEAIERASHTNAEVWIAEGTYTPRGHDRGSTFRLRDGVKVLGGFRGDERSPDARDPAAHPTVLSGDIGAPGVAADNAYHVLEGANGVLLDGLVIEGGNADGATFDGHGGGLVNYDEHVRALPGKDGEGFTDVTLRDVVFRDNHAVEGGALYAFGKSTISLERVRFERNYADFGGAVVLRVDIDATFTDVTFAKNRATYQGGGVYLDYGVRPTFSGCVFEGNAAGSHGGAAYLVTRASQVEETTVRFDACRFADNTSGARGGAVANTDQSLLTVSGSTFTGNRSATGEADVDSDESARVTLR